MTGSTKSFVVSWFAVAHDISDDQCPQMNVKPSEEEYYALMSKCRQGARGKRRQRRGILSKWTDGTGVDHQS